MHTATLLNLHARADYCKLLARFRRNFSPAWDHDQALADEKLREQLRQEWQRLQAGSRNSGATAILEQGLKWQALGLSTVDS